MQYTSGSTSEPKGVMVTHGNLSANLQAIVTALRAGSDTVVASWLPQYHDMGLIGAYLGALYCGGCGEGLVSKPRIPPGTDLGLIAGLSVGLMVLLLLL